MKRCSIIIPALGMILVLLAAGACAVAETPAQTAAPTRIANPGNKTDAWQKEWDSTTAAAKQEGDISITTSLGAGVQQGVSKAFNQKYGINVEWDAGRGAENMEKIMAQRRAGLYTFDLTLTGVTSLRTLPGEVLEPMEKVFVLPEVKDVNAWWDKKLPFYRDEGRIFSYLGRVGVSLMINTQMVKPEDIKSWRNLLEPKWKGKILLEDPTQAGAGNAIIQAVWQIMGIDYLKELAKQDVVINLDKRLQVEWVARGKYPVAFGYNAEILEEFRGAGAPVAPHVPSEGTYFGAGVGYMAMLNKPAHPEAAKLFVNWFLSREGQSLFTKVATEGSRRIDIPSVLPPDRLPQPGIKYIADDTEEALDMKDQLKTLGREIFFASR